MFDCCEETWLCAADEAPYAFHGCAPLRPDIVVWTYAPPRDFTLLTFDVVVVPYVRYWAQGPPMRL